MPPRRPGAGRDGGRLSRLVIDAVGIFIDMMIVNILGESVLQHGVRVRPESS